MFTPDKVSVPAPDFVIPPAPPITPEKLLVPAMLAVSVWLPSTTAVAAAELPDRLCTAAPDVEAEMSSTPLPDSVIPDELATLPAPVSASVPALTEVPPV